MTKKRDRVFAFTGAVLFLVTSAALTIAVIWQSTHQDSTDTAANTTNQNTSCQLTQVSAAAGTAPSVYKTPDKVTQLQTTDLTEGTGQAAKNGDCLVVKYYGTVADSGTMFDEDFTKDTALQLPLGSSDPQQQVIQGWEQGLVGMKAGGERRLVIPANLAYGANPPAGSSIPANAALVFDVKLLKIQNN